MRQPKLTQIVRIAALGPWFGISDTGSPRIEVGSKMMTRKAITRAAIGVMTLILASCAHYETVEIRLAPLEMRAGLHYRLGGSKPYTGFAVTRHSNGKLLSREFIVKGQIQERTIWYENGRLESQTAFSHGQPTGKVARYFDTAERMAGEVYSEGVLIEVKTWTKDGRQLQHLVGGPIRAFHGRYQQYAPREIGDTNVTITIKE